MGSRGLTPRTARPSRCVFRRNFSTPVVAAEDARLFHHHGFDRKEIGNAGEDLEGNRSRGASTITQQTGEESVSVNRPFRSTQRRGASIVPLPELRQAPIVLADFLKPSANKCFCLQWQRSEKPM
jgi:Transglycosylase